MANEKKLTVADRQAAIESLRKQAEKFMYGTILQSLGKTRTEQLSAIRHGREEPDHIQSLEITIKRGHKKKSEDDFDYQTSTIVLVKDDTELIRLINTGSLEEFGKVVNKTIVPDNTPTATKTSLVALWNALEDVVDNMVSGQNNKALHLLQSAPRFQNAKRMWENHIKAEAVPNAKERLEVVLYQLKEHEDFFAKIEAAAEEGKLFGF